MDGSATTGAGSLAASTPQQLHGQHRPEVLISLTEGQPIPFGGNRLSYVDEELARLFGPGDRLVVVQTTGELLRIPAEQSQVVDEAVSAAHRAFHELQKCTPTQISAFFEHFAHCLEAPEVVARLREANLNDVAVAQKRQRSTTRLEFTDSMHQQMIEGLRIWRDATLSWREPLQQVDHGDWSVKSYRAPLGVVGFVFEGRPNVFADAVGVLRTGNTVVFRIGSDALGTARAIMEYAVRPSLAQAGLPDGAAVLVDSAERSSGLALFSDPRLSLAVARGSGQAVAQLGTVARQAGVPVSLHGTGGAWMLASSSSDPDRLRACLRNSLDRKVCNTTNVVCVTRDAMEMIMPVVLDAIGQAAQQRGTSPRIHVTARAAEVLDPALFEQVVNVDRPQGIVEENYLTLISEEDLGIEWEWEGSPEVTVAVVEDLHEAVNLFNRHSPQFVISLISADLAEQEMVYSEANAPFMGDGFTRWVDGQYALVTPELGLSNWEGGRLLGRSAILSGDSVHTVRLRAHMRSDDLRR
jgi:glutamate-5-semialdehyde dehydrogenase